MIWGSQMWGGVRLVTPHLDASKEISGFGGGRLETGWDVGLVFDSETALVHGPYDYKAISLINNYNESAETLGYEY